MGEGVVFVDVTYHGLRVAQRARFQLAAEDSGFVETEAPLPVGTTLRLEGEGMNREARVISIVEQESSAKSPPGMLVSWKTETLQASPDQSGDGTIPEEDGHSKKGRRSRKRSNGR
ncbi:MAG: hypothetical protein HY698_07140 [Deltaproteobacteria bacterium]|nr:hypothetical protein [Deltaproteobacteria bacterium]